MVEKNLNANSEKSCIYEEQPAIFDVIRGILGISTWLTT